jgi:crotonobetainyl-CoA:carnitine CoA-transferase CaiB-like acyl-CoA transferase
VAAALQERRDSAQGTHVDASMYEICVQQTYAAIELAQRGVRPERMGNADRAVFHQGVYPAAGTDRWLAITCHTGADWQLLRQTAGLPEAAQAAERDAVIGAWTASQDAADLMQRLQTAGIAAGVVQDIEDLLEGDPQLALRGALVTLEHPLLGAFGHVNTPLRFSRSLLAPYRPPGIGEHSHHIAAQIAGLPASRIAELERAGVFQ